MIELATNTRFLMIKIVHYSQRIICNNYSSKRINVFSQCVQRILFALFAPVRQDFFLFFFAFLFSIQSEMSHLETW